MRNLKRFAVCFIAAVLAVSMLTACGGGGGSTGSGANSNSNSTSTSGKPAGSNSEKPADSEKPASSEKPTTPTEYPKTWADSKTKKFLNDKGITAENLYMTFKATIEDYPSEVAYAVKGKRSAADATMTDGSETAHRAVLIDEKGNGYFIDYDEKTVETYPAGSENFDDVTEEMEIIQIYAMLPNASNVGSMTASDYTYNNKTYYMESFKLNVFGTVATWDYLYAGNELKYIIGEKVDSVAEIKSISANPPESCFALPSWNAEAAGTSRTVQYFKQNAITNNRFYFEGKTVDKGTVICTANGEKAYYATTNAGESQPYYGNYAAKKGEVYDLNYQDKTYMKNEYRDEEDVRTAWGSLYNPAFSGYTSMKAGNYQEGGKTYYKETFYSNVYSGRSMYEFVFDGKNLKYIISGGTKLEVVKWDATPNNNLLKLPDGWTEFQYDN